MLLTYYSTFTSVVLLLLVPLPVLSSERASEGHEGSITIVILIMISSSSSSSSSTIIIIISSTILWLLLLSDGQCDGRWWRRVASQSAKVAEQTFLLSNGAHEPWDRLLLAEREQQIIHNG